MKNIALTLAAALSALTSTAAFIPQANQAWVTNKIDEVVGTNTAARIAAVAQAATNYTDYAVAAAGGVTPLVVTNIAGAVVSNIVRSINGGVWDAALQVWWTPVMSNGKLTYQATTNVNLNAGN